MNKIIKIKDNNFSKGFTLIELLVVISIIGMLSSIVLATLSSVRGKGTMAAGQTFDTHTYVAWNDNLVLSWDFDTDSGSSVQDQSGNGNNLTLTNATLETSPNPFNTGKVLALNTGTKIADSGALLNNQNPSPNGSYSVSLWVYDTTLEPIEFISNNFSLAASKFKVSVQNGGLLTFISRSSGNSGLTNQYSTVMEINKWYHVLAVCDGVNKKIIMYINGKAATNASSAFSSGTCSLPNSSGIYINGANLGGAGSTYYVDDVRIYNNAFTITMAEQLYLAQKAKYDNLAIK